MNDYEEDIIDDNRPTLPGLKEFMQKIKSEDLAELSRMLERYSEYKTYDDEEDVEFNISQKDDNIWQVEKVGKKVTLKAEIPVTASKKELIDAFLYICNNKVGERYGDDDYWLELSDSIKRKNNAHIDGDAKLEEKLVEYYNILIKYGKIFTKIKLPEVYDCIQNEDGTFALCVLGIPFRELDHIESEAIAQMLLAEVYGKQFRRVGW